MRLMILTMYFVLTSCASNKDTKFTKTEKSVSIHHKDKVLWTFNCHKGVMKPHFHPLAATDGTNFTDIRPRDHVWHYGMWFCFKFINSINYWEERNGKSVGTTFVKNFNAIQKSGKTIITVDLIYYHKKETILISEKRKIFVSTPDKDGNYTIDWSSNFKAKADIIIDRTPLPGEKNGKGYGGYAGLSLRCNKNLRSWSYLNDKGESKTHGKPTKWINFSGKINNKDYSITFFDHSKNMSYPSSVYTHKGMPYFSPAFLFRKSQSYKKGKTFSLKYKLLIENGKANPEKYNKLAQ